jgi:hypothetical protein
VPDSPEDNDALLRALSAAGADDVGTEADLLGKLNYQVDPNVLDGVDYTGDLEQDSKAELTAVQQGFRDRAKREQKRFEAAVDTEYWFCVCFKTRADKNAFLAAAGLKPVGDKYLDGYAVARKLGVPVEFADDE